MKPAQNPTYLIYLIGKSGVGKYSVATELEKNGFILCDNQLINYPVFSLLKYDGLTPIPEQAWDTIAEIQSSIYAFISRESTHNYVLTNVLGEIPKDHQIFSTVQRLAQKRHSIFIPVKLSCAIDENIKRIQNPDRKKRYKSIDIQDVYSQEIINITHPHLLELDVTNFKPIDVAIRILEHAASLEKILTPANRRK